MNCKNLLLFSLIFLGSYFSSRAQMACEPNLDFELGTTANWNYYRGSSYNVGTTQVFNFTTCLPAPTLHTITSGSTCTDYYGGFPCVGDGLYSLKLSKDSANTNSDAADYHVHVPGGAYSLIYRFAVVFEDPGHLTYQQPKFEIIVTDSATNSTIPCNTFAFVSSGSLPGFTHSAFGGDVYYKPWTAGSLDLTGMGGKTVIVRFNVGGCTLGGHWGYAYVDMNCGLFKIQTVGCSGGTATLSGPPGYSAYNWTDSLTFTKAYGTTQTVVVSVPTLTTTYALILTPYSLYGCVDTLYAKLIPSNMVTHQAHDTAICQGSSVRIWGGATDILPLTYSWTPTTGLSCSTCDTTWATPPVGVNLYKITTYNTGGCLQTDTIKVTVYPNATSILGEKRVCLGLTSGLSDAVTGGSWTTANTTIATIGSGTGVVTGVSLGTAIITYSFAGICPVFATVTVEPLPGAITGTNIVCVGFNTSLTDASGPGTWTSSTTAIATVGSTGVVTGMSPGTCIITYFNNATTCYSVKTVSVIPLPASITGITTICQFSTTTLVDPGGGVWTSSNTAIATVGSSSGDVYGVAPGTATITYTIGSGCYVTTLMTILLSPGAIKGTPYMCAGATSALSDSLGGGAWASSDFTVATVGAGGVVTGVGPVTAIISYSFPTGCRATTVVTVYALPTAIAPSPAAVCLGQTLTLSDALVGGTWSSSNTNCAIGSSSGIVTGSNVGTSTITYKTAAGCSVTTVVTVNPNPAPITGTKSVCSSLVTCLTDVSAGGTWASSSLSVASVLSTGCVSGVSAGTTTISYTLSTGCLATTVVTVNAAPTAILGSLKVCPGQTTALSDATAGGTWASSNTNVAIGVSTGVATGNAVGTSIITYTATTGCVATAVVTVNPGPAPIVGPTAVCVGATTKLTDATGGGAWASSNTTVATVSGGTVSGLVPGSTTITYTLVLSGCYTTTVVTVSLAPGPIGGTKTVCLGATTTLSDGVSGGTWTSVSTSVATIDPLTGLLTGVGVGTSTITYSLGGACTSTAVATVLPLPAAISGTASVCINSTTALSDATPGGTWSTSTSSIAAVSGTGVVTGNGVGTATISYTTSTFGCSATKMVTVNPLPAAIGTTQICSGSSATLTDATPGGTWTSSVGTVATIGSSSGIVTGGLAGTSTITYKLTTTGCLITAPVTVNPLPAAVSGPTSVCVNSSITVSDATGGGTWSSGSTNISITTGGLVTGGSAGPATVTYVLPTGCSITGAITVNPLPAPITGPTAVCIGKNITLSDATTGGTWTSLNTAIVTIDPSLGIVTGGSTLGSTTVVYTISTGCQKTTTVAVSPSPGPIVGPSSLCVGTSVNITDAVAGGGWVATPTSIGTIDPAGSYTGVSAGTGIVTYSLGSGCTVTQIMTVNPLPSAIAGGGAVCLAQTLTLSDLTPGGVWTSSNTAVATVAPSTSTTSIVTPGSVGTATITYSLGCIVTTTVTVSLSPATITGPATVCNGNTTTLSDAIGGGTWTSLAPSIASVPSGVGDVLGVNPGTATIVYSLGGSCTASQVVTVYPVATITGAAALCTGHTTTLTSSLPGTWSSTNTAVATISTGGIVSGVAPGPVTIVFTTGSSCITTLPMTISSTPGPITPTNAQVCVGATTTLSDASGGGTWSSTSGLVSVGASSGDVSGLAPGVATIVYSLGSGCQVTAPVTVNALPAPISGSSNLCALTTTTLTCSTTPGTWSTASGLITVGPTSGVVTAGATGGTAIVTYTRPTGCFATKIITINPLPAAIGGLASMCVGQTTVLTNTGTGTWSSANPSIATIGSTTGIATGVSAGTASIIFKTTSTGCTIAVTATVVPAPTTIVVTPAAVCVGGNATLTSTPKGGVWSSGDPTIASVSPTTGIVTALASGTVPMTYSVASGCYTFTTLIVNPISPIIGSNVVCKGQTATMLDTTLGGSWSSSDITVAPVGLTSGVVSGTSTGTAVITYTTPKGCVATHLVAVNPVPTAIIYPKDQICLGQATIFSDKVLGGTWSSSDPLTASVISTGAVTGVALGTATISYTVGGCAATKAVTVNPLPAPITGGTDVCVGYTTVLSSATPGGTWSSRLIGVATVGLTSGVVTGMVPGVSTISYTVVATGCYAKTDVTVHPNPLPTVGFTQVCVASTITLSNATPGGSWSSPDPTVSVSAGAGGGDVLGLSPGTAAIYYTIPTGCYAKFVVTVNPLPGPIAGSMQLCKGSTETLSDAGGGTWSSSDMTVATIGATSGSTFGVSPGTSIIDYTLATSCFTSTVLTVNPLPLPITGPNSVCVGHTTTLSDGTLGGNWTSGNTLVAVTDPSNNGDVQGVSAGFVNIYYTDPTTTCSVLQAMNVTPTPKAIAGNQYVCIGSTYTFTDPIAGGSWTSSNPGVASVGLTTGVVSGLSLGSATIYYTMSAGCDTFININVVPLPTVFSVTGGGTRCSDDTGITLGLNGSVVGTNYFLYKGTKLATGPIAGTSLPISFGPQLVAGTYTVMATNTFTGCSNNMAGSAIINVTPVVFPNVTVTTGTGDTMVCSGATTVYTAKGTSGGPTPLYVWDINGTVVSTSSTTYTFIPADGDVVTCTMTSDAACARPAIVKGHVTMKVVTPATPSAALSTFPGDTICQGLAMTFTPVPLFGGSAPTYTWYVNKVASGSGPTFTYVPNKGDIVYASMTSNYPCLVKATVPSNNVAVTVDSAVIPNVKINANPGTSVALGQNVTLSAEVTGGGPSTPSYQWIVNGMPILGATNSTYSSNAFSIAHEDSVSVTVTSTGMCTMTTHQWVYISVHNVGVKQVGLGNSDISVLPNPNKGEFTVKGTLGTSNDEQVSIEMTDLLGQVVYRNSVLAKGGNINERVILSNTVANGMYMLSVRSEVANQIFHVVIEQ